jgi:hypothetical protein
VTRLSRDGGRTFEDAEPLSADTHQAGYPVVGLFGDTAIVAWQERPLPDAVKDSVEHAHMNPNEGSTYINNVGALQVVARMKRVR